MRVVAYGRAGHGPVAQQIARIERWGYAAGAEIVRLGPAHPNMAKVLEAACRGRIDMVGVVDVSVFGCLPPVIVAALFVLRGAGVQVVVVAADGTGRLLPDEEASAGRESAPAPSGRRTTAPVCTPQDLGAVTGVGVCAPVCPADPAASRKAAARS